MRGSRSSDGSARGSCATPSTVLQENDVLHVLMRSADAPMVERVLTHAPSLKEN